MSIAKEIFFIGMHWLTPVKPRLTVFHFDLWEFSLGWAPAVGVYKPLNVDLSVADFSNLMPHESCSFFGFKASFPETELEVQRKMLYYVP